MTQIPAPLTSWLRAPWTAPVLALVAVAVAVLPNAPGVFESRVRAYLLNQPQLLDEMITARDTHAHNARIDALNRAATANPAVFQPGPGEVVFGPADARVTVIEYFDYQCGYCKSVAPAFIGLVRDHPEVRFIFREWPILDRPGEITSQYAARAALVAHAQGRYLDVHQALMAERALSVEGVNRILAENGVDIGPEGAALNGPGVVRALADVSTGARVIGLDATPTIFINGRALASNDPAGMAQAIASAR